MKGLKINYSFFKKRLAPITMVIMMGTSMIGFSGCSKNDSEDFYYKVKKSESEKLYDNENNELSKHKALITITNRDSKKYANYDHYVDFNYVKENESLSGLLVIYGDDEKNNNKDFVYPVRHINYTTSFLDSVKLDNAPVTTSYFRNNSSIIFPDSIKWAESYYKDSNMYLNKALTGSFVGKISFTEYQSVVGNKYLYQESLLKVKDTVNYSDTITLNDYEKDVLKEGDYILNKTLYKVENSNLVILANKQEGIGSSSNNVEDAIVNNLDDVFKEITNSKNIQFKNTNDFKKYIYGKKRVKKK